MLKNINVQIFFFPFSYGGVLIILNGSQVFTFTSCGGAAQGLSVCAIDFSMIWISCWKLQCSPGGLWSYTVIQIWTIQSHRLGDYVLGGRGCKNLDQVSISCRSFLLMFSWSFGSKLHECLGDDFFDDAASWIESSICHIQYLCFRYELNDFCIIKLVQNLTSVIRKIPVPFQGPTEVPVLGKVLQMAQSMSR